MKKYILITCLILLAALAIGFYQFFVRENVQERLENNEEVSFKKEENIPRGDLIVIAALSMEDVKNYGFPTEIFQDVINFDIAYVNAAFGKDEVRILVDEETSPYFEGKVPEEVLVDQYMPHIWMRDFTTVNPDNPIQFRYTSVTFENGQEEADFIQESFNAFTKKFGFSYPKTKYLLDGGNVVDNYAGRAVVTNRFLEDNKLPREKGKEELKKLLGVKEIALVPPDEEIMAHSDGMVMFVDEDTIIVNRYDDELFREEVMKELRESFPGIEIVEIEADWDNEADEQGNISSACGINVNSTVTTNYIYMPHFGNELSDKALKVIQDNTTKIVVPVPSEKVCKLGGSVRCLTWQLSRSYLEKEGLGVFK